MGIINTKHPNKNTDNKRPTRYYSNKQEKQIAKKLNGTLTKNSGATMFQKGDLSAGDFLIDCITKTTSSDSISIIKDWLEKNEKEALFMGKEYSALAFNFGPNEKNYYIISEELFESLFIKNNKE